MKGSCSKKKLELGFCMTENQPKSPHSDHTETILIPLLAEERLGEGKTCCTFPRDCFWNKKILGELILHVRPCSFAVQLLPSNPVFVLLTIATEVFHFIHLLFLPLQLPKINAGHGSEAFFLFYSHALDSYLNHFVLLICQFENDEATTTPVERVRPQQLL